MACLLFPFIVMHLFLLAGECIQPVRLKTRLNVPIFPDAAPNPTPCDVGDCWNLFEYAREVLGVRAEYPPPPNYSPSPEERASHCVPMRTFYRCIQNMTAPCRGDLSFHSAKMVAEQHMRLFNCSFSGKVFAPPTNPDGSVVRPTPSRPQPACTYRGDVDEERLLCSVYGDPHVRAFDGSHAACRVAGAWTMLDNEYLMLQVTSEPIPGADLATAITKVGVVSENGFVLWVTYKAYG
jgi:hypothetical protein